MIRFWSPPEPELRRFEVCSTRICDQVLTAMSRSCTACAMRMRCCTAASSRPQWQKTQSFSFGQHSAVQRILGPAVVATFRNTFWKLWATVAKLTSIFVG